MRFWTIGVLADRAYTAHRAAGAALQLDKLGAVKSAIVFPVSNGARRKSGLQHCGIISSAVRIPRLTVCAQYLTLWKAQNDEEKRFPQKLAVNTGLILCMPSLLPKHE
ncbi:MAG: hypothetical protein AAGA22_02790 [Pseudomonadota bacterium]